MSRAFSSKKPSSLPPPPTPPTTIATTSCRKKKQSPRSPLLDLNRISSSSNSSYASSNVSTEAPKGCLRFLSSSSFKTPVHRPKNLSKIPNSVPNALALKQSKSKPSKENPSKGNAGLQTKRLTSDKAWRAFRKNPPCLYQRQSGKKSVSRTGQKSKPSSVLNDCGNNRGKCLPRLPSASEELKRKKDRLGWINDNAGEHTRLELCHSNANFTPLGKKVTGDVEENSNTSASRTPPIHNSVSPEIQYGSSLVSTTTPACYGAGYVVSGVTDKRKCRPRGILTIEKNYSDFVKMAANSFDDDEKTITGVIDIASPSFLPFPTEALVHWLSSPRDKGKTDLSKKSENGLNQNQGLADSTTLGSSTSPSSSSKAFWNITDSSDLSSAANGIRRKMISSISPSGLSEVPINSILFPSYPSILFSPKSTPSYRAGNSEKEKPYQDSLIAENSPISLNSLGSGNVIRTPHSDSSTDLHFGFSWALADNQKEDNSDPDLNSVSEVFESENVLPNSSVPMEDSVNSSFHFDCINVPFESIDLSKLPKVLDYQDPSLSSSTIENASQSQMTISSREVLMGQLYELDEFDCCRCLSDEEDLAKDSGNNKLYIPHGPQLNVEVDGSKKLNDNVGLTETDGNELEIDRLDKEMCPSLISWSGAGS